MTQLLKELDIHDKIDYNMQYDKSFVEPLKFLQIKFCGRLTRLMGHKEH